MSVGTGTKILVSMLMIYVVLWIARPSVFMGNFPDWLEYVGYSYTDGTLGTNENITHGMMNESSGWVAGSLFNFFNWVPYSWSVLTWLFSCFILPIQLFNNVPGFPGEVALIMGIFWITMYIMAIFSFIRGSDF